MEETINKFKDFFKIYLESRLVSVFYAWLSPSGQLHSVDTNHGEWAEKYLKSNTLDHSSLQSDNMINLLFKKGWFRITRYGESVYCHNPFIRPSGKPLKSLIDNAIEYNIKNIRWDNEDDDIILWMNEDY